MTDLHALILAMAEKLYLMSSHLTRLAERKVKPMSDKPTVNGIGDGDECWLLRSGLHLPVYCPAAVIGLAAIPGDWVVRWEGVWLPDEVFATRDAAHAAALDSFQLKLRYHTVQAAAYRKAIRDLGRSEAGPEPELGGESG